MKKLLALLPLLVWLTGCATSTGKVSTDNAGFGPYVAGPYETAAINYVTLSLY